MQFILRDLLSEVRKLWLPVVALQGQSTADFIEAFRRPWVRFRLDRFCNLTPRQESLVKQIVTAEIGREERKQAKLDAAISKRLGPDRLPSERAFDSIRKRAKELKKRGILVVFDEAELFFPERNGHELANNLKDRL